MIKQEPQLFAINDIQVQLTAGQFLHFFIAQTKRKIWYIAVKNKWKEDHSMLQKYIYTQKSNTS